MRGGVRLRNEGKSETMVGVVSLGNVYLQKEPRVDRVPYPRIAAMQFCSLKLIGQKRAAKITNPGTGPTVRQGPNKSYFIA